MDSEKAAQKQQATKSMLNEAGVIRVCFPLEKDTDGYPPFATETLWATTTPDFRDGEGGIVVVNSIPFFAKQATLDDAIVVIMRDHMYYYDRTLISSQSTLLRLLILDKSTIGITDLRTRLHGVGCKTEWMENPPLIAVHIGSQATYDLATKMIRATAEAGSLEYEEAILWHS